MRCPSCSRDIPDAAPQCTFCGHQFAPPAIPPDPPPAQPATPPLAPRTSGLAVASLILGILGLLGITALAGLVLGIISLSQINRSRNRLGGRGIAIAGIVVSSAFLALSLLVIPISTFLFVRKASVQKARMIPGAGIIDPRTGEVREPRGDRRSSRRASATRSQPTTPLGGTESRRQDVVCRNNLQQLRYSISTYQSTWGAYPSSLDELQSPVGVICPVGGEPYEYDQATGEVRCAHLGHTRF